MIYSMTSFARQTVNQKWGQAVWELRSVNHRYLDISIRLPESLKSLEIPLRKRLGKNLQRGKIECSLRYNPSSSGEINIAINHSLVKKLIAAAAQVNKLLSTPTTELSLGEIISWPNVISVADANLAAIHAPLLDSFDKTLAEFIEFRGREGDAISKLLQARWEKIKPKIKQIRSQVPAAKKIQRKKLLAKFAEAKLELDPQRLEQEMLILAQKSDVAEELDRLVTHIAEVQRTIKKGGAVGRRLDFLMQELNREANTLAAKSISTTTTLAAVEIKVLIEQMREQVQNVE